MNLEIPPAPPSQPMRWRRALREMRALFDDPDSTEHAIDFMYALGSRDNERNFQRFAASERGRALLAERPSLLAALSDRAALARMPEGSLGRAYLEYLESNGFEPGGLVELQHRVAERWEREEGFPSYDEIRIWYRDRGILVHDLFHLVTGYPTDDVGEATLLAFSLAQFGGRAQALLTIGAALDCARATGWRFLRYELQAWRRGRRAPFLVALPWEELLPLRLETVQRLAQVPGAEEAHPEGIWRGQVVERPAH
jgi:ubiquinone biosynthesis protein COQ4